MALALAFAGAVAAGSSGVTRESGANRYATAADISAKNFVSGVDVVYIATGTNFPDALAAGPAAAKGGGPVLLVRSNDIPQETRTELDRLNPDKIVIAGGTGVVSAAVAADLAQYGPVTREWGANRYGTAANISLNNFAPGVDVVYVATGTNFPDALAAGPSASWWGGPVLLVKFNEIPQETATELDRLNPARIVIAGGTGVVSSNVEAQLSQYVAGAPVATDDTATVLEDSGANVIDVLANDSDPDGDALSVTAVGAATNGTATVTAGGASVTYAPNADFFGTDTFTYTVTAGGESATATVTVTVTDTSDNLPPVATNDNVGNVGAGCWKLLRVLNNDSDPEGDATTITAVSDPAKGSAATVDTARGTVIRYVSDTASGPTGGDSFTYTLSDSTGSDTATVTINVTVGTDTDGDGINDECDPFAAASDALPDTPVGFVEEFDDPVATNWTGTGFTGLMTNSVRNSLSQITTAGQNGTGRFVVSAGQGDSFRELNTLENGFQVNIASPLSDFVVLGSVCQPFPGAQFASEGIVLGTGDQENFIKLVVNTNASGATMVEDVREVEGAGFSVVQRLVTATPLPDCIVLRIVVDRDTLAYTPNYSLDGGSTWIAIGTSTSRTVPLTWLDGTYPYGGSGGARALAVGITSRAPVGGTYAASWDYLRVLPYP